VRYAAIDIGSNAVRLLIADTIEKPEEISFKKNTMLRVPLRLGEDAFVERVISKSKADELVKTMQAFKNLMDVFHVDDYLACATSAMREATNGQDLVKRIKQEAGLTLEIVEGQREAHIIYSSHANDQLDKRKNYLYIDVGGGSTELSLFSDGQPEDSHSFNIGTIRILDKQDKPETWEDMKQWIRTHCKDYKSLVAIGTGGNINKLFRMSELKEGAPLTFPKLQSMYNSLSAYSLHDRISVLGLNPDRADVIIPACQIYLTVMKWADIKQVYVPKVGMVDGIIQSLIEKHQQA
jgi:exopolyphosphatase/guanosine-5'-triphosphate,3'-diphosphate pyrophosphatase